MKRPRPAGAITAGERVSDVLARDEALVAVFARHSPNFARLRNRAMRRVMAPLVTVEQAARIAGIPVGVLLRDLNAALGVTDTAASSTPRTEASAASRGSRRPAGAPEVELDVRPLLRAGEEPFSRIMAAVSALGAGEVLHLRATFEPHPLLAVMAKRGFISETAEHAPDDWSAWFWRTRADSPQASPVAHRPDGGPAATAAADRTIELDVRGLEPPEPLMRTLVALETLPPGWSLLQINSRVPQLLFPLLAEQGFACDADESHADRVLVRIWRPEAAPPSVVR
ncbi:MAG: DUF2249 domain-containing protein [Bacillota bacterium]